MKIYFQTKFFDFFQNPFKGEFLSDKNLCKELNFLIILFVLWGLKSFEAVYKGLSQI